MVSRYSLSRETILACCREGYALGFRTFVLQGGEDLSQTDDWVEETVACIRKEFPDCAITLSLGEKRKRHINVSMTLEPTDTCFVMRRSMKHITKVFILWK